MEIVYLTKGSNCGGNLKVSSITVSYMAYEISDLVSVDFAKRSRFR